MNPQAADQTAGLRAEIEIRATADIETRHGVFNFRILVDRVEREHVILVRGDVGGRTDVLTRIHSECMTGEVFGSLRCDCAWQLDEALSRIAAENSGVLIYLRQEGRGIGLTNKIRAYDLQQRECVDTIEANIRLGLPADARRYGLAADVLKSLDVRSVKLLTNNPDKVRALRENGIPVTARTPLVAEYTASNRSYLETKRVRSHHAV
jgi:GTP cyclohydrolase II